jgi:shikimate kinase
MRPTVARRKAPVARRGHVRGGNRPLCIRIMGTRHPIDRIALLGFMSSGKSTVGQSLARRLNWEFIDFDVEIERREELPVAALIERQGEDYFRGLEAALTREIANREAAVLAPGGGWIMNPALLESIRPGTLTAWLRVSPAEVVRRLREQANDRPFKDDPDAIHPIAAMLEEREPLYRLADMAIPVDGRSTEAIAFELEQIVRYRNQ